MSGAVDAEVLIIGAGPTGMVAALALARLGVTSILLERQPSVATHPKAHEVSPRSIEILTSLGVSFAAMDAEASSYSDSARVVFCARLDEEFGRVDLSSDDARYFEAVRAPKPFLNLSQTALEQVLRAELLQHPQARLQVGYNWRSLVDVPGAPVVSTALPVDAGKPPLELRTRYVLCADGAGSTSRRALGIAMKGPECLQEVVNAYVEHDLGPYLPTRAKLFFSFDPSCVGTFVAHHVDRRWVYHTPIFPPFDRAEDFDAPEMVRRFEAALGRRVEGLTVRSIETWRMTAQVAERFRSGRAFLVGDAAHRFPPTGGLGMNSGIADAHNLAWKLAAVLRGHAEASLLDTYEAERRPVVERNCTESVENFQRLTDLVEVVGLPKDGAVRLAKARRALRRWLPRGLADALLSLGAWFARRRMKLARTDPKLRVKVEAEVRRQAGHFDRLGLDLGALYDAGALVPDGAARVEGDVAHYAPTTRPGARLPHRWLDEAKTRSTHDLLDFSRFTLLVDSERSAWSEAANALQLEVRVASAAVLETEAGGAVLVRPDGYVAWRSRVTAMEPVTTLRAALQALSVVTAAGPTSIG